MKDKPDLLRPIKRRRSRPTGPPPPAPEVVDGGEWKIQQSASLRVAGIKRNPGSPGGRMVVPLGEAEQARLVRAHELMHVHITPEEWPRPYNEQMMNMLEDGRVHRHLHSSGFDLMPLTEILEDAELKPDELTQIHPAILGSLVIGTTGTGESQRVREALAAINRNDIVKVADQLTGHFYYSTRRPDLDSLGDIADHLIRALGDPDEPPPPEPEPEPEPKPEPEPEPGAEPAPAPPPPPPPPPLPDPVKEYNFGKDLTGWGDMRIVDVPLIRRLPGKMRGRRRIVPDTRGRRLRRVGRLHVDGRVFGNRPPLPGGGAVLIDASGSMSLTNGQIEELVRALPGGIVASYSGNDDGWTGELRIIAKNGRFCSQRDIRPPGGANIIDGPALEWLGKQRGPRYWVSDGKVTGIREQQNPALLAERDTLTKRHQIRQVKTMEVLLGT